MRAMLIAAACLIIGFLLGAVEGRSLGHGALAEIHAIRDAIAADIKAIGDKLSELETSIKGKL